MSLVFPFNPTVTVVAALQGANQHINVSHSIFFAIPYLDYGGPP